MLEVFWYTLIPGLLVHLHQHILALLVWLGVCHPLGPHKMTFPLTYIKCRVQA